jgi:hypothetical protein
MPAFEIRVNFSDGYEIQTIDALSINGAAIIARTLNPAALDFVLLATVDRSPQKCLVFA